MNVKEITAEAVESMKLLIDSVLEGKEEDVNLPFVSASDAMDYLETKGYDQEEIDSNGWQYDFWIKVIKSNDDGSYDKVYSVDGSGYYGGLSFRLNTDDN